MIWRVELTSTAAEMIEAVSDRRIRGKIRERIDGLSRDPDLQGKPLTGELSGYRSLRAAAQRYRILYRLERGRVVVIVVAVGLRAAGGRADVYALAQKLLRLGLLSAPRLRKPS